MNWMIERIERKKKKKILNNIVNILIIDIADEYLVKLKQSENKPPIEIQEYLNQAVYLAQKRVKIKKTCDRVYKHDDAKAIEFNKIVRENKEYKSLVFQFNFVLALIKEVELQEQVVNKIYDDYLEVKKSYMPMKKQREQMFNFKKMQWDKKYHWKYIER